jgi:hypothetical protein
MYLEANFLLTISSTCLQWHYVTLWGMQSLRIFIKSPATQTDIVIQLTEYRFQKDHDHYFFRTLNPYPNMTICPPHIMTQLVKQKQCCYIIPKPGSIVMDRNFTPLLQAEVPGEQP